jgi:hypothetical protein
VGSTPTTRSIFINQDNYALNYAYFIMGIGQNSRNSLERPMEPKVFTTIFIAFEFYAQFLLKDFDDAYTALCSEK